MSTPENQEHDETADDAFDDELNGDDEGDHHLDEDDDLHHDEDEEDEDLAGAESDPPEAPPAAEAEEEYVFEEVIEDGDHRVAQLRKLRSQFVSDGELSLPSSMLTMEDSGPSLIVCPNCSSEEVRGQRFCSQCNARLPNIVVVEQKYNPGSIDGAARKYHDAIHKFQQDAWTLDQFVDFLTKGLERVRAHSENLGDLSSDGVIADWLPEASQLIADATHLWYVSVDTMLAKVEDSTVEFEEEMAELEEDELTEREQPLPLEDRVRMIDFTPELEGIFKANDQMLEYLRILDTNLKSEAKVGGMQF